MAMLKAKFEQGKFVCVGLDSEFSKIPKSAYRIQNGNEPDVISITNTIAVFNQSIIKTTKDIVCAYKLNIAFYEAHGDKGLSALQHTILCIHRLAPDVPIILDAKRGDIGNTNDGYVKAAFDFLQADAITVHPYLGAEALQPFLDCKDKGIIVLCRTSNSGAGEFQDLLVDGQPLYQFIARQVTNYWNKNGNCILVVGATYPEELKAVRDIVGDMPLLIPGVGFQQKDVPLEEQIREVVVNALAH
ncbi:MAG: orotidine-5'-phosphate decarboxylase [Patescibacteria group bacterium]